MKKMKAVLALALALCTGLAFAPAKTVFAEGETTDSTLTGEDTNVEADPPTYDQPDDSGSSVAVDAQEVDTIKFKFNQPKVGMVINKTKPDIVVDEPEKYYVSYTMFTGGFDDSPVEGVFEVGKTYYFEVYFYPNEGYAFSQDVAIEQTGLTKNVPGYTSDTQVGIFGQFVMTETEPEKEPTYELIDDENTVTTFTEGSDDEGVCFHIDGDYDQFDALLVDGKQVRDDGKTAIVAPGSTIVILTKEFLATLGAGEHKVEVIYKNGKTVTATFTIKAAAKAAEVKAAETTTEAKNDSVKTGDDMLFVFPLMAFAVMGILALGVSMKKKED